MEQYDIYGLGIKISWPSRKRGKTQLVVTTHDLLNFYDQNKQVDTIILDFRKAFDTVPHQRLLLKLENYGIRGNLLSWISNFLTRKKCL